MASGLGKCLKLLKRNPYAILLVSNTDRIARRADIFELIQKQGLGHRIYDASTGLCLDGIVQAGRHRSIEKQTEKKRETLNEARVRFLAAGGVLGSTDIAKHSREAVLKKKRLAKEREADVLSVLARLVRLSRGKRPTMGEICDELRAQEIHTGQGRFFTSERLSQFKKKNPQKWRKAYDSYSRPRRRIRRIIFATLIELRNRRDREAGMTRLHRRTQLNRIRTNNGFNIKICISLQPRWQDHRFNMCSCRDGCRGPPVTLALSYRPRCYQTSML